VGSPLPYATGPDPYDFGNSRIGCDARKADSVEYLVGKGLPGMSQKKYDVALSFAGEDRVYVKAVADALQGFGLTVFYDEFVEADLLGRNLIDHLSDIYQNRAKLCVLFVSEAYASKPYTTLERQSAQARAFLSKEPYIIPVRLDDTYIPGLLDTVAYASGKTPATLALLVASKLYLNEPTGLRSADVCSGGQAAIARFVSLIEPDMDTFMRTLEPFESWSPTKFGSIPVELRVPSPFLDQIETSKKFMESAEWHSAKIGDEARRQFATCYNNMIPQLLQGTIKGINRLIAIYLQLDRDRLKAVLRRWLMCRNTLVARLILDMRLVGMAPVEWEYLFAKVSLAWSRKIMDGLTYVAFLEGDERYLWVDVDGRGNSDESYRLFAPSSVLVGEERIPKLTPDEYDRFFAMQFLDKELNGDSAYALNHFANYPDRLQLRVRGEWGYETQHFGDHGTSNFSGEPFYKVVRDLYEHLMQETDQGKDPEAPIEYWKFLAASRVKRLFRNGGGQFDHLLQ